MPDLGETLASALAAYDPQRAIPQRKPTREDYWRKRLENQGAISNAKPSLGEKVEGTLGDVLSKALAPKDARRIAHKAMGPLNDVTPVGNATGMDEGGKQFTRGLTKGDLKQAAVGAAVFGLSAIPGAGAARKSKNALLDLAYDETGALKLARGYQRINVGPTEMDIALGTNGLAELQLIRTPAEHRGQGHARTAMQELVETADQDGLTLALTPDPMDSATSKRKLEAFYREFGFVPNAGRNKDFATRGSMIRPKR